MKIKIKGITIMFLMFSLLLVNSVFALDTWQLIEYNNEWQIEGRTFWNSKNNPNDAYLIFKYDNSLPFTQWKTKIEQTICSYVKPSKFSHFVNFSLSNETTTIKWGIEWYVDTQYPIIQDRIKTYIRITDSNDYSKLKWIDINPAGNHFPIEFSVVRLDATTLNLKIAVYPDNKYNTPIGTYAVNYTLSESFFNTAKVYQSIQKRINSITNTNIEVAGVLKAEALLCNGGYGEQIEFNTMPFWQYTGWAIWNGITAEINLIGTRLRELMPYLGWLYDSLAFCFTFAVGFVKNVVNYALPFFPFIILFWMVDAIFTSIQEGNLQPIGNIFMSIFDFLRGVIQTIVNILSTIYDYVRGLFP